MAKPRIRYFFIPVSRWVGGILCATAVALLLGASSPADTQPATRHPHNSLRQPWPIPGTIEAENFDQGTKDDPAYFDTTPGSSAPADERYRDSDVDIGVDPLLHLADVGWIDAGEWMEYTVQVRQMGRYTVSTRIATPKDNKHFRLEFNKVNVTGSVPVPNTGCWGSDLHGHHCFQEAVVKHIPLKKGIYRMRFVAEGNAGEKDLYTVDKFRFILEPEIKGTAASRSVHSFSKLT